MFDHTFIISLPTRKDRRQRIAREFKQSRIATLGENASFFDAIRPDEAGEFSSIGAKGCFMSHLGCLQRAKEMDCQTVGIIEDDVVFPANFQSLWPTVVKSLKASKWDLFYGGYFFPKSASNQMAATKDGVAVVKPDTAIRTSHCMGFQGQAIDAAIAYLKKLASRPGGHPDGGPMHVDGAYSWFRKAHPHLTTVAADPIVANQGSSRSDIADLRWFDQTPAVRVLVNALRDFKQKRSSATHQAQHTATRP